jgi:uncharacterized protein (DUF302 family)
MPAELLVFEVPGDVASVVDRLTRALDARGITLFATIDHGSGARAAGLELGDEVVLVFGNPAVGTSLMQADPRVGLDLPLRILAWTDAGVTRVAYEDPRSLADRYRLAGQEPTLAKLDALLDQLRAEAAAAPG